MINWMVISTNYKGHIQSHDPHATDLGNTRRASSTVYAASTLYDRKIFLALLTPMFATQNSSNRWWIVAEIREQLCPWKLPFLQGSPSQPLVIICALAFCHDMLSMPWLCFVTQLWSKTGHPVVGNEEMLALLVEFQRVCHSRAVLFGLSCASTACLHRGECKSEGKGVFSFCSGRLCKLSSCTYFFFLHFPCPLHSFIRKQVCEVLTWKPGRWCNLHKRCCHWSVILYYDTTYWTRGRANVNLPHFEIRCSRTAFLYSFSTT